MQIKGNPEKENKPQEILLTIKRHKKTIQGGVVPINGVYFKNWRRDEGADG